MKISPKCQTWAKPNNKSAAGATEFHITITWSYVTPATLYKHRTSRYFCVFTHFYRVGME